MGSPISTWENASAYFTGFGGATPSLVLALAVLAVIAAIVIGHVHETHAYSNAKED